MNELCCNITLDITEDNYIFLECNEFEPAVEFDSYSEDASEPYTGEYDIVPVFVDQALPTKGKTLSDDITVKAIPVSRTTNPAGGKTVYIGGI